VIVESIKDIYFIYNRYLEIKRPIQEWNCYKKGLISNDFKITKESHWLPYESLNFKVWSLVDKLIENKELYLPILYTLKENYKVIQSVLNEKEQEIDLNYQKQLELLQFTKQFENVNFKVVYNIDKNFILPLVQESKSYNIPQFILEDGGGDGGAVGTTGVATVGNTSADIAQIDSRIPDEVEERTNPETLNGKPVFKVSQDEFLKFKDGKKFWRWNQHTLNDDIRKFSIKNPTKSFYVKYKNYYFLVKRKQDINN